MKKLSKKEKKAFQEEIAMKVKARYECFSEVDELASEKLFHSIMRVFEKRNEPVDVILATLKKMICGTYFFEVTEEMGFELDDFKN